MLYMAKAYSITSKYQVTLPRAVRTSLGLSQYDKVQFSEEDGKVVITKAPSLGDVQAHLHKKFIESGQMPATDEQIKNARGNFYKNSQTW